MSWNKSDKINFPSIFVWALEKSFFISYGKGRLSATEECKKNERKDDQLCMCSWVVLCWLGRKERLRKTEGGENEDWRRNELVDERVLFALRLLWTRVVLTFRLRERKGGVENEPQRLRDGGSWLSFGAARSENEIEPASRLHLKTHLNNAARRRRVNQTGMASVPWVLCW